MPASVSRHTLRTSSSSGLSAELASNGALRRLDFRDIVVNLFPGNELEGGPANIYLRMRSGGDVHPLLGPASGTSFVVIDQGRGIAGQGRWQDIDYRVSLLLAESVSAWFWHVQLRNTSSRPLQCEALYAQDVGLSGYGTIRLNEYYVSQYVDHTPLEHGRHGWVVASRQNQSAAGRNPWSVIGSLRRAEAFATDALQWYGLAARAGALPPGLRAALPAKRLQHEHSLVCLQDAPQTIAPGDSVHFGFFGLVTADHPEATSPSTLR